MQLCKTYLSKYVSICINNTNVLYILYYINSIKKKKYINYKLLSNYEKVPNIFLNPFNRILVFIAHYQII